MTTFKKISPILERDPRYPYEAYMFVFHAIEHTQKGLGRGTPSEGNDPNDSRFDLSSRELAEGMCDLARKEFGLMASVVFRMWGIRGSEDFGEIFYNLIDAKLMSSGPNDCREDCRALFDVEAALSRDFRIVLEEE